MYTLLDDRRLEIQREESIPEEDTSHILKFIENRHATNVKTGGKTVQAEIYQTNYRLTHDSGDHRVKGVVGRPVLEESFLNGVVLHDGFLPH